MSALLIAFIAASFAWTLFSLYLSARQASNVRRNCDAVPADFAGQVSLDEHRKAARYTIARERVASLEQVADLALTLIFVLGLINWLYAGLATIIPPSLWRGTAFLIATAAIGTLASLPFSIYKAFVLEQRFGFNRTNAATFLADRLKGWAISLVVSVPLLYACLWIMHHVAGLWWLWTWCGLLILMVVAPSIYVRFIAPRFNTFTPLEDGAMRARIERLLARSGFRASGLFTMDASKRTAHGNAFFIGFGKTKRIVLFDTLLQSSTPDEIEAVIAHELGHFRHHHIISGLARGAVIALVGLAAFGWLCKQPWLLPAFGIQYQDDALSLYICALLFSVLGPLIAPAGNWISRHNEYQADDYARRSVGAAPLVSALTRLARDNASTLTPDPLYALVHHSHPSVPLRVRELRSNEAAA